MAASNLSGQIADVAQAVTTSDTASNQYTYLYIGGAGNVSVITRAVCRGPPFRI